MKNFCPHCGYDLVLDSPILIDDFSMMSSHAPLYWRGEQVDLTGSQAILCYSLMKAYPDSVRIETLMERIGSESECNVAEVLICRIRKKLREMGAPNPIAPTRHRFEKRAYIWVPGVGHVAKKKAAA